ncbi:hypothetical protein FSARC_6708 [Fusarium sarcochroum]|uniref:Uncharacterized protein n=1 Tax=Fusarium sarcochroum TaxID=1208366 RepID=A0A8H4TWZ6_9HYPO|nr:hypothetical protein FSARC_6708 [Fusarium sarcochroum]
MTTSHPPRKGRGRPRKDWTVLAGPDKGRDKYQGAVPFPQNVSDQSPLNPVESSVLDHFVSSTGPSLGNNPTDPYGYAWSGTGLTTWPIYQGKMPTKRRSM